MIMMKMKNDIYKQGTVSERCYGGLHFDIVALHRGIVLKYWLSYIPPFTNKFEPTT